MSKQKNNALCIIEGCENVHSARGLCARCYAVASKLVKEGKTTWVQLGKMHLAETEPEVSRNPFMRAFQSAFKFSK